MISVLVPTFNYDISSLVATLHQQLTATATTFEIICLDDHSTNLQTIRANETINSFSHTTYKVLSENIGRSKIRNLLAKTATYDWLLFLDADVIPVRDDFAQNYVNAIAPEREVIYGGILYQEEKPPKAQRLRWVYGKKREALTVSQREKASYLRFLTLSFLIRKDVFEKVAFNEEIPNARHEDTLFAHDLKHANIHMTHIHNPVYHLGLDTSDVFIRKSMESVAVLPMFLRKKLLHHDDTLITKVFAKVKRFQLHHALSWLYKNGKHFFENNLRSARPSMFIFDLYRLTYLCFLDKKQS